MSARRATMGFPLPIVPTTPVFATGNLPSKVKDTLGMSRSCVWETMSSLRVTYL